MTITSGVTGDELLEQIAAAIAATAASAVAAAASAAAALVSETAAAASETAAAASAAALPTISGGDIDKIIKVNSAETGYDFVIEEKNIGDTENLGVVFASSTLSIAGKDGSALSATNKGYVGISSKANPGQIITVGINAVQGFIDATGASEIIGNLFGASTGIAWADPIPFYIYAVLNDAETEVAFMISRIPHLTTSPVVGEIGAPDDAVADNSFSFFSFENIDETLYDSNPCVAIGSFRMVMSTSDDWTVQTLGNGDGIGQFQEGVLFTMPLAQNGAATGTYFKANGGTAPLFDSNQYQYLISRDGQIQIWILLNGDPGIDGVGAVIVQIALPMTAFNYLGEYSTNAVLINSITGGFRLVMLSIVSNDTSLELLETDGTSVENGDFGNGGRRFRGSTQYLAGKA